MLEDNTPVVRFVSGPLCLGLHAARSFSRSLSSGMPVDFCTGFESVGMGCLRGGVEGGNAC